MKLFQTLLQSEYEFLPILIRQEFSLDRRIEKTLFKVVRDPLAVADSLTIFFCGHYYGCRVCVCRICYAADVAP